MARWIGEHHRGAAVETAGEVGTTAYYCDCRMLSEYSDPGRLAPMIAERFPTGGPVHHLLALNFRFRPAATPIPAELRLLPRPDSCPAGTLKSWETGTEWRTRTVWCLEAAP